MNLSELLLVSLLSLSLALALSTLVNSLVLTYLLCVGQRVLVDQLSVLGYGSPASWLFDIDPISLWEHPCYPTPGAPGSAHTFPASSSDLAPSPRSCLFSGEWHVHCDWVFIASVHWFRKHIFSKNQKTPQISAVIVLLWSSCHWFSLNIFKFMCLFCCTESLDSKQ